MYTLPLFAYIFIFLHIFDIVFACLVISFLSEMFLVQLQYWWKVFCLYPR